MKMYWQSKHQILSPVHGKANKKLTGGNITWLSLLLQKDVGLMQKKQQEKTNFMTMKQLTIAEVPVFRVPSGTTGTNRTSGISLVPSALI